MEYPWGIPSIDFVQAQVKMKAASTQPARVKTFVCPTVTVPPRIHRDRGDRERSNNTTNESFHREFESGKSKRSFGDNDGRADSRPGGNGSDRASSYQSKKAKYGTEKTEMSEIMKEIKDLSSTALLGSAKKKYKEDILTKLGAAPVKEQTMPFKMKMGILKGRKRREDRAEQERKESGVVVATSKTKKGKKSNQLSERDDDKALGVPNWNVNTFNGVLHLSKKNLR
jgi:hypothetical protein